MGRVVEVFLVGWHGQFAFTVPVTKTPIWMAIEQRLAALVGSKIPPLPYS
ncbi:MAG: hypothetical protein M3288_09975 [Thermoproteota archaeon]|nr:hypothetical protein [Thermoproteota archaeon]